MKFAVAEGGTKTVSATASKYVGLTVNSIVVAFFFQLYVSVIQMLGGIFGTRATKGTLRPPEVRAIWSAGFFGVTATAMTVISVYTFMIGADLGVRTFLFSMSILPGALIDWLFFGHPLNRRQMFLGIPLFLLAGYTILDFPALDEVIALPAWVWWTLLVAVLAALNEAFSQATAKVDKFGAMPNNFWVGLFAIASSLLGLVFLRAIGATFYSLSGKFWLGVAVSGVAVVAMISFKLLSYKGGGSIALKKVVMKGTYLVTAAIAGVLFYNEPISLGKVLGILGFFVAFAFMDNTTWETITRQAPVPAKAA